MAVVFGSHHQMVPGVSPIHDLATRENLQSAIGTHGKEVFSCKFKNGLHTYSPAQCAVFLRDKEAFRKLAELSGAKEYLSECTDILIDGESVLKHIIGEKTESLVHFYFEICPMADIDVEMLELLIDHLDDPLTVASNTGYTIFPAVIEKWVEEKSQRWEIIEILLKRQIPAGSAFSHLKRCLELSDGKTPFATLTSYIDLHQKYYPSIDLRLTREEFVMFVKKEGVENFSKESLKSIFSKMTGSDSNILFERTCEAIIPLL
ncbi:MAG: hypothetical protein JSS61_04050 [Verrucomicrobia bacterium]|nr:hypothetical protein [Verrucomicrobiota bacterium]